MMSGFTPSYFPGLMNMVIFDHFHEDRKVGRSYVTPEFFLVIYYNLKTLSI